MVPSSEDIDDAVWRYRGKGELYSLILFHGVGSEDRGSGSARISPGDDPMVETGVGKLSPLVVCGVETGGGWN